MVIMELFGMNGTGKTTTILAVKEKTNIELPLTDIEHYSFIVRNGHKVGKVLRVIMDDPIFASRMFAMMWKKHRWTWDTIATWFNLCHRGYYYLFQDERRVVLGGGILHKVWGTYGMFPITEKDRQEMISIIHHFGCKGGYYLDVPKEVVLKRNTNRGHNTFLERKLDQLDFVYENFYYFVEALEEEVKLCAVKAQGTEERVEFLLSDCEMLMEGDFQDTPARVGWVQI